jgi:outer membrane receptor protein involved in Fe transport
VPDASFRDLGLFVQDEWAVAPNLKVVAGLRYDHYRVVTENTPGYDGGALAEGARPPIDPSSLPNAAGDSLSRQAVTGDLGLVYRVNDELSVLAHYGRSYRHANLEELLYSGSATVGAIVPNLNVGPETGHNVDVGIKVRTPRYAGSLSYFNNAYDGFISTEIVATTPTGPISQAINFADVRIQGVEGDAQVPLMLGRALVTLFGNFAYAHGEVLSGTNPLSGISLAGTPQDNITPFKSVTGVRVADRRDRVWIEYGNRYQADVDRVAVTLIESPYLIAQDLFSLQGFTIHRLAWGVTLTPPGRGDRLGLTFAIENLTDRFYREQFQFAPARGRSVTVALHVRGH